VYHIAWKPADEFRARAHEPRILIEDTDKLIEWILERTTANMYLTLLHLAGASRDTFGQADPGLKDLDQHGPLEELLA
jgi:hypothetical protein